MQDFEDIEQRLDTLVQDLAEKHSRTREQTYELLHEFISTEEFTSTFNHFVATADIMTGERKSII